MWQAVLEALPYWRRYAYVIGKVNAPIGAGKNLLWLIGIDDYGVHRNVRQIAGLVRPCERATIRGARYLEDVTRGCRCVSVETANSRVPDG